MAKGVFGGELRLKPNLQDLRAEIEDQSHTLASGADRIVELTDVLIAINRLEEQLREYLTALQQIPKHQKLWRVSHPLEMMIKEILGE